MGRPQQYALTFGKNPIPMQIWNKKIIAAAPNAAGFVFVESRMAVIAKQKHIPPQESMRIGLRP
jgi:hypothetical protein